MSSASCQSRLKCVFCLIYFPINIPIYYASTNCTIKIGLVHMRFAKKHKKVQHLYIVEESGPDKFAWCILIIPFRGMQIRRSFQVNDDSFSSQWASLVRWVRHWLAVTSWMNSYCNYSKTILGGQTSCLQIKHS